MYIFWNKGGMPPSLTPAEMQKRMQKWMAWTETLSKSGHLKGGESLESAGKVVWGPKKVVTFGPHAAAGDVVNGYLIISAQNLDEAVELAKDCPVLEGGWVVEVRQIRPMQRG